MFLIKKVNLDVHEETSWSKTCVVLSRAAPQIICNTNLHTSLKLQFVDFFLQVWILINKFKKIYIFVF